MNDRQFELHQENQFEIIHYLRLIAEKLDVLIGECDRSPEHTDCNKVAEE